jgi:hypothetical protein
VGGVTHALSQAEFLATLGEPMTAVSPGEDAPFDLWPYFEAIPAADFEGHDCSEESVTNVIREPSGRYVHVLVNSEDPNVFMVLVLDLSIGRVYGHRLLDLNREYGLESPGPQDLA